MRSIISIIVCAFISISTCMAQDHIIFRNGTERDIKLYQINNEKLVFKNVGKAGIMQEVPSTDVYMVYIEKQGNIYITPDGKRITGEPKRADVKHKNVIYLIQGAEIAVEDIIIKENHIAYSIKAAKKGHLGLKRGIAPYGEFDKADVFMIRYKSGLIDVITPAEKKAEPVVDTEPDTKVEEQGQPEYVVLFHAVEKGETLNKIAKTYNVTPEEIVEWNDLPSRLKPTSPLGAGTQLLIYQPKK